MVISNDAEHLSELARRYDGCEPDVQRQGFGNNVTWFRFIAAIREDGRLVPKALQVCHVWQAASVVASGSSLKIQVPPRASALDDLEVGRQNGGDKFEPVFAVLFRFQGDDAIKKSLICTDLIKAASSKRGSPYEHQQEEKPFYQVVKRIVKDAEVPVCQIGEVLGDVHLFTGSSNGGLHLVIELANDC